MDDPQRAAVGAGLVVRIVKPVAQPRGEPGGDVRRDHQLPLLLLLQDLPQIHALDELHRDEDRPLELAELVHGDDVRVVQLGGDPRLVEEHPDELVLLRQVGEDPLDHRQPVVLGVLREVQLRHSAHGQPLQQQVLPEGNRVLRTSRQYL